MRWYAALALGCALFTAWVLRAQRPFKEYPAIEYTDFPLPPDWQQASEWTRARLKCPGINRGFMSNINWTMDYPRSDRHLLMGVRRLTRIDTRSVEQVVELDGADDVYNWPAMYAVEVGHWRLPDDQVAQLREFLMRGGFLMVDDFHGTREWQVFMDSMSKVFPDRPVEDLPNSDPIFHTLYDLDQRFQVPGAAAYPSGVTYEQDGFEPRWRAIRDAEGRVMVAICHNMDLGDAWELSDEPDYQEKWASLAYRIGMNYFIYDLTH
jgi:hypothetical protein